MNTSIFSGHSGKPVTGRAAKNGNKTNWPFSPQSELAAYKCPQGSGHLTRASMLADIFLVVVWGASIPGLMWLGALGGF